MNYRRFVVSGILLAALMAMAVPVPVLNAQPDVVPGRYIVVLREFADPGVASKDMELTYGAKIHHVYTVALRGFAATIPDALLAAARQDQRVRYIVPDRIVRAFQKPPPSPGPKPGAGQQTPTGVNRIDADLNPTAKIDTIDERVDVDIAIIDTGVATVADINLFKRVSCLNSPVLGCVEGSGTDGNGHGTHVAGTAGAIDNTIGVVGVAPGARIWAIQVLNALGFGTTSDVVAGINYVAAHKDVIEVANMSLGGAGSDDNNCGLTNNDPMHEAICNAAPVVFTVAAGNEGQNAANVTPAAYNEVITVSAFVDSDGQGGGLGAGTSFGADDTMASFSNFGSDVDIAAPGVNILSTWRDGTYRRISGTSMASPHVAGAVALYIVTHGKPVDQAGVDAIRAAIVAAGECVSGATNTGTSCTVKWPGDKDTNPAFFEPLLDAAML